MYGWEVFRWLLIAMLIAMLVALLVALLVAALSAALAVVLSAMPVLVTHAGAVSRSVCCCSAVHLCVYSCADVHASGCSRACV